MNLNTKKESLRIALLTYSTKPRGGVVHTLELAENLYKMGHQVHIFALGKDEQGFFRSTSFSFTLIPCEMGKKNESLDNRIECFIDTYFQFLIHHSHNPFDIYHAQDCVSANALWKASEKGLCSFFIRTIHHIDDFVTPRLIQCQNDSIYKPNYRIVVSEYWKDRLRSEFGLNSHRIYNGVNINRFRPPTEIQRNNSKKKFGVIGKTVFLSIGGIEPRKNSIRLLTAFDSARCKLLSEGIESILIIAGGETLFDYTPYRTEFFDYLDGSELEVGKDLLLLNTVEDEEIPKLYHAADSLLFPSVKEGWGLVVLESMASGLPVLTSDISVFKEYLHHRKNAIMVNAEDESSIESGIINLATDVELRQRLSLSGPKTARLYTWDKTANEHLEYYYALISEISNNPIVK
ncbi:MAG: glycosyl transferase [Candidatus Marinimicrobia bacterium]|nr:glycosyl transferase [Candidatus Neomarinimicrobiota bacterium]|tara:strand:+ start:734 stop:1948 length:1215 start_codon:yes stop_codon:yes gene_type:complete